MLFSRLLQAFDTVVSRCGDGSIAAASRQDILLKAPLQRHGERLPGQDWFAWVTAFSARSGIHASSQVFVLLEAVPERGFGDKLRLRVPAIQNETLKHVCVRLLDSNKDKEGIIQITQIDRPWDKPQALDPKPR